jgi:hypothetical protein
VGYLGLKNLFGRKRKWVVLLRVGNGRRGVIKTLYFTFIELEGSLIQPNEIREKYNTLL